MEQTKSTIFESNIKNEKHQSLNSDDISAFIKAHDINERKTIDDRQQNKEEDPSPQPADKKTFFNFIDRIRTLEKLEQTKVLELEAEEFNIRTANCENIRLTSHEIIDILIESSDLNSVKRMKQDLIGELGYRYGFCETDEFEELAYKIKDLPAEKAVTGLTVLEEVWKEGGRTTITQARNIKNGLNIMSEKILNSHDQDIPAFVILSTKHLQNTINRKIHDEYVYYQHRMKKEPELLNQILSQSDDLEQEIYYNYDKNKTLHRVSRGTCQQFCVKSHF